MSDDSDLEAKLHEASEALILANERIVILTREHEDALRDQADKLATEANALLAQQNEVIKQLKANSVQDRAAIARWADVYDKLKSLVDAHERHACASVKAAMLEHQQALDQHTLSMLQEKLGVPK